MLRNFATPSFLLMIATAIVLVVLAASWLPESRLSSLEWLPAWMGRIADFHPNLRTALPFIPLAFVLSCLLAQAGARHPNRTAFLFCMACVSIAETGQLFLPERTADLRDVASGGLGTLVGILIRQTLRSRRPKSPERMLADETNRNWIVCQIGARENYTIPRALHKAGRLDLLLTDIWKQPGGVTGDLMTSGKMFQRWHQDLADATVRAANRSHLTFEAFTRARNDAKTWKSIISRNERFQRNCARLLELHAVSRPDKPRTVFAFSYAAREIFRFAKSRGWTTVLGQIDPGPREEAIVAEEHEAHPGTGSTWHPAPPSYWDHWREEVELADQIIVNSPWARDGLATAGVPVAKIRIVPLFYEEAPRRTKDAARKLVATTAQYGTKPPGQSQSPLSPLSHSPLHVLFIGNVCLRKGIGRLIEAMRLLRDQPVHLSIYGHLSISPALWKDLPNVSWAGAVRNTDIRDVYAAADVFILPTISDGFARTQLEALAAGTPVIATHHCGDVITHGKNGFLLEHNTPEEIAALLSTLAADRSLLQQCDPSQLPADFPRTLEELAEALIG